MDFALLNFKKLNQSISFMPFIFYSIFGILVWHKLLFNIYLPGIDHLKKLVLFILAIIWTIGFIVLVGLTIKNSKLGLYTALMLIVYTIFFNGWMKVWGFPLLQSTIFYSKNLIFYFFLALFILIFLRIRKQSIKISRFFLDKHIKEGFIFFLFFSMAFFITKNVYDSRDPTGLHGYYFTDRNLFPPDHRILVPSFVEVAKNIFQLLNLEYFADVPRLYKIYMLITLTCSTYFYCLFLKRFFKEEYALMISVLTLFLFSLSFYVGGLVDDPLNILAFIIGLILIYYRYDLYFWLLIFIASFNKETIWFLIFIYFVHNLQFITKGNWWVIFGKTAIFSLTFIGVSLFKIILKPIHSTDFNWITYNFSCEQCILHVFLLLNIFWILAFFFAEYPKRLSFFSRLNFITPFYVAWHFLGLVREVRLFIPIALILVPLGIGLLFPEGVLSKERSKSSN